jgi:hypothetical protein
LCGRSIARSIPTSTARSVRSCSQSIRSSAKVRLAVMSRRRAVSNSSPAPVPWSGFRTGESGGLWWRGWSDDRCHQHRDHHHRRRTNRCARDYLLHPERIASVAASTGPRLAPTRMPGLSQYALIRSTRSKSGSIKTWSSSARGAGPRTLRRSRSRRSSSSGLTVRETNPVSRARLRRSSDGAIALGAAFVASILTLIGARRPTPPA